MKRLFYFLYICIVAVTLFQASRLIGTSIEKLMLDYPVETKIDPAQERISPSRDVDEYDISLFSSPLFSLSMIDLDNPSAGEVEVTDSPLLRKYELNGVIMLPDDRSIALIRRAREKESGIYRRGDFIDNLEIIKIERHRVYLNDGLKTTVLPMYYKYKKRRIGKSPESQKPQSSSETFSNSKQVKKVLSRSDVENRVFSKVNQILTQIAISPYMVNGKMEGLRLIKVPNNSIVYELGGRSGDIIRRVNGHEVQQVDQMYKLWENIKDDSLITVDLERKNQLYQYSYEIRE